MPRGDGYLMRALEAQLTSEPQTVDELADRLAGRSVDQREAVRKAAKRLEKQGRAVIEIERRLTVRLPSPPSATVSGLLDVLGVASESKRRQREEVARAAERGDLLPYEEEALREEGWIA